MKNDELEKLWRSKEWKEARKKFLEGRKCLWCGKPATVVHHPDYNSYKSAKVYIDLILSKCQPFCKRCNWANHKGYHLCPKCKAHYTRHEQCWRCLAPESKRAIRESKEKWREIRREYDRKRRAQMRKMRRKRKG